MRRLKYIAVLLLAISTSSAVFTSCNSDDSSKGIDGVDASTRLKETEQKLKNTLVASEDGWVVDFYPNNTLLGGFRMWFKFNEDGSVLVRSDINFDDTGIKKDEYDFVLLSTVGLNFSTGGVVHEFIKMNEVSNHTDIEFLVDRYDGDNIIFKGHTTRREIVFQKATAQDRVFDLSKNKQMWFNHDNAQTTLFKSLEIVENGTSTKFALDYNSTSRFGRVSSEDGTPLNTNGGLGFGFTSSGLMLSPAIKIGDEEVSRLDYNAATKEFVGTATAGKVVVKNLLAPLFTTDDYIAVLKSNTSGSYLLEELTGAPASSDDFLKAINDHYAKEIAKGADGDLLESIEIGFRGGSSYIGYVFKKKQPLVRRGSFAASGTNGKIVFTGGALNGTLPDELKVIDQALSSPAGFFIKKENYRFGKYGDPIYSISSASSFKIKFAIYLSI